MPRLAANLSTMFREAPFLDRFELAAKAGFRYVECQFPYDFSVEQIDERLVRAGVELVLFNLPLGNFDQLERGLAIFPDRRDEFRRTLEQALDYASALDCPRLHCMAGLMPADLDRDRLQDAYRENLIRSAGEAASRGLTIMIEPLNPIDMPGYYLQSVEQAVAIIAEANMPNLLLQYDLYHRARSVHDPMGRDLVDTFERYRHLIGHIQIAGAPGRYEPDTGAVDFSAVIGHLDATGYEGFVGCEWNPRGATEDGLEWARPFLQR